MKPAPPRGADATRQTAVHPGGTLRSRVHAALAAMIADGRIRPGERLLEVRVADAFRISRSPARATLEALCRQRLLNKSDGRGYVVAGRAATGASGRLATLEATAIAPVPLWERVYADVEQQLAYHVLFRSVRVTEERLAEHFSVSRTVARDVLARMHAVGMIGKDKLGRWWAERATQERIRHLYELRWLLEPAALRLAAPRLPVGRLKTIREAMAAALGRLPRRDVAEMDRLEYLLHVDLMTQCPNRELVRALEPTRLLLVLNRYLADLSIRQSQAVVTSTLAEHLAVVDRLLARDWEGAAAALEAHLRHSCDLWQVRYRQAEPAAEQAPLPGYLTVIDDPGRGAGTAAP